MRRLAAFALVLAAACGPRGVLGHGAHAPAPASATPNGAPAASVSRANLYDEPRSGQTLLDTPITVVSAASAADAPSGVVISRLPAPHRIAAALAPAPRTIADAFALVGHRDSRESLAFALAIAASLGGAVPVVADGPARAPSTVSDDPGLVDWARERAWFAPAGARLAPGDLVVFDRAAAGAPASLVGVVLATDERGVTSFLYLARGVVRIGHLDPARPRTARDREGRTVNSYLRHTRDYPPAGTRYLAGELFAGAIRLSSAR